MFLKRKFGLIALAAVTAFVFASCPGKPGTKPALPIEMVWVPGGVFELGREINPDNPVLDWYHHIFGTDWTGDVTPVSTVTLTGFWMGRFAVTQGQFEDVMGFNPSYFTGETNRDNIPVTGVNRRNLPVEDIGWHYAIVFANRLSIKNGLTPAYEIPTEADENVWSTNPDTWGEIPRVLSYWTEPVFARLNSVRIVSGSTGYRLPTEAQWEFAAKGGASAATGFMFPGSDNADDVAWHLGNSGLRTHEVGLLAANCLGLYDMSGNVWEAEAKTDPTGPPSGSRRMARGGSWGDFQTRSVDRFENRFEIGMKTESFGFRLVRP